MEQLPESSPPARHSGFKSSLVFATQFLRYGRRVASLVPSSPLLARELASNVDPDTPQTVLELGAGTGVVTQQALTRKHPDSRVITVEINPRLADITESRCPQATVLRCDAAHLEQNLLEIGIRKIDVLINCLPTPSIPAAVNRAIFECVHRFSDALSITQLTEIPWFYMRFYRRLFEQVRFQPVPVNIPPAGVYHLGGLRDGYERHL